MTKCLLIECEKEAKDDFPCCSNMHGTLVNMARAGILENCNAYNARQKWGNREYTIEEALTYL